MAPPTPSLEPRLLLQRIPEVFITSGESPAFTLLCFVRHGPSRIRPLLQANSNAPLAETYIQIRLEKSNLASNPFGKVLRPTPPE